MSAADDQPFVSKGDRAEVAYADDNAAAKEDAAVAKSEETGKISKGELSAFRVSAWSHGPLLISSDEVEGLKDTIGGGAVLDDSEGYTRSSNKSGGYEQAEQELDSKVDEAS